MAALKEGGGRQQHIFGIKPPATLLRQGKLSKSSYQEPGFQWHMALFWVLGGQHCWGFAFWAPGFCVWLPSHFTRARFSS